MEWNHSGPQRSILHATLHRIQFYYAVAAGLQCRFPLHHHIARQKWPIPPLRIQPVPSCYSASGIGYDLNLLMISAPNYSSQPCFLFRDFNYLQWRCDLDNTRIYEYRYGERAEEWQGTKKTPQSLNKLNSAGDDQQQQNGLHCLGFSCRAKLAGIARLLSWSIKQAAPGAWQHQ